MSDPFVASESDHDDVDKKRFVVEKVTGQPRSRAAVRQSRAAVRGTKLGLVISLMLVCASSGFAMRSKAELQAATDSDMAVHGETASADEAATDSDKAVHGETASADEADLRRRLGLCSFARTNSSAKSLACGGGFDDQIGTVALDGMSLSFTYYVSSSGSYSGSFGVCIASWFIGTTTSTLFSQCYSSSQVTSMCGYDTWCTMSVEISGDGDDDDDATYDDDGEAACEGHGYTQTECEAIGCCQWDDDDDGDISCWSAVGTSSCTGSSDFWDDDDFSAEAMCCGCGGGSYEDQDDEEGTKMFELSISSLRLFEQKLIASLGATAYTSGTRARTRATL